MSLMEKKWWPLLGGKEVEKEYNGNLIKKWKGIKNILGMSMEKGLFLTTIKASIAVESLFLNFFFFCPLSGFYVWQKPTNQTNN